VTDLAVGSPALQALRGQVLPLQAHAIFGVAAQSQAIAVLINWGFLQGPNICPSLLPGGFNQAFGEPSDLLVSKTSQMAVGLAFSGLGGPPVTESDGTIHAVDPLLFSAGPDALSRNVSGFNVIGMPIANPQTVINLLNTPIYDTSSFAAIRP